MFMHVRNISDQIAAGVEYKYSQSNTGCISFHGGTGRRLVLKRIRIKGSSDWQNYRNVQKCAYVPMFVVSTPM